MNTKYVMVVIVALVLNGSLIAAEPRPYLGVLLDDRPLPELLVKHLRLDVGQGVRIRNIHKDSAADKAGLERDDIIIGFQGEKVTGLEAFVDAVRAVEPDKAVSLEVIHLGERKAVELRLGTLEGVPGVDNWKYPPEPQLEESWMPGRVFHMGPGDQNWQILTDPCDINKMIVSQPFAKEQYRFKHVDGDKVYDVRIEGSPDAPDTKIKVNVGNDEYEVTVKDVDKLPKDVQTLVEESLKEARESASRRLITPEFHWTPPAFDSEVWKKYFEDLQLPQRFKNFETKSRDEVLERLEREMKATQERLDRYEQRSRELYEKLIDRLERRDKSESDEQKNSESSDEDMT